MCKRSLKKANLSAVKLSQNTTSPVGAMFDTQLYATPLVLVPMVTYASKPKPSKRLHNKIE